MAWNRHAIAQGMGIPDTGHAYRVDVFDEHVQDRRVLRLRARRVLEAEHLAPPRLERFLFCG